MSPLIYTLYTIQNQIKNYMHSLHAQVMEFYIIKHFTIKCKFMLSFELILKYLKNCTNEDMDIYRHVPLWYTWLLY